MARQRAIECRSRTADCFRQPSDQFADIELTFCDFRVSICVETAPHFGGDGAALRDDSCVVIRQIKEPNCALLA